MSSPMSDVAGDPASQPFAEVIAASTQSFWGECLEPLDLSFPPLPPLGSWVKAQDDQSGHWIYGVVSQGSMAPMDSLHRARALGLSTQELRDQQPQIFAMLKTEFQVIILGFAADRDYAYLPPRPPQIHQAIYACDASEVNRFTENLEFLRSLLSVTGIPVDELLAATIRQCWQMRRYDRPWLVTVGRTLSILLRDNYDQLSAIIRKIQP
ncbi:MAG: hypothetical protein OHK0012_25660 [Synechococcales cyanobacterium]